MNLSAIFDELTTSQKVGKAKNVRNLFWLGKKKFVGIKICNITV